VFGNGSRCAKPLGNSVRRLGSAPLTDLVVHALRQLHVVRDLKPITRQRLKAAIPGRTWKSVAREPSAEMPPRRLRRFHQCLSAHDLGSVTRDDDGRLHPSPQKVRFGHPDRRARRYLFARQLRCRRFRKDTVSFQIISTWVCSMIGNAVPQHSRNVRRRIAEALRQHMNDMQGLFLGGASPTTFGEVMLPGSSIGVEQSVSYRMRRVAERTRFPRW